MARLGGPPPPAGGYLWPTILGPRLRRPHQPSRSPEQLGVDDDEADEDPDADGGSNCVAKGMAKMKSTEKTGTIITPR